MCSLVSDSSVLTPNVLAPSLTCLAEGNRILASCFLGLQVCHMTMETVQFVMLWSPSGVDELLSQPLQEA